MVDATATVDEEYGAALPGLLLPTDHELAAARGGPPVDAAQVVALPVVARGRVVLAGRRDRPGPALSGAGPVAAEPHLRQRHDLRGHHEDVRGAERPRQLAEAERVGEPHGEGSDAEPAAQLRAHGVVHVDAALRHHPVEDEPRPTAEHVGDRVLGQHDARGQPRHVLQTQHHARGTARRHAHGLQPAGAGEPVAGPGHHRVGDQRQADQEDADAREVDLVQHDRAHERGDTAGEQASTADGESGENGVATRHPVTRSGVAARSRGRAPRPPRR